jgi:intein/homing endonuclease
MRTAKFLPAISILASSARDESSFTETIIKEIEAAKDPEHQIVYRNAVYKIKKHSIKFSGMWFKVCYGLKTQEPYVLTGRYLEDGTPVESEEAHEKPPSGAGTELVPVEYLVEYKRRTRTALQSISGISTGGSNRFFPSTIDLERCIELSISEGIVNPCKTGVNQLAVSMEDNTQIWDYLDHNRFLTIVQSRVQPKRHPEMARFAHLDLATQTMAGLSVCHLVGTKLVTGLSDAQGNPFQEYRLIVEFDFILTICAGRIKPISLEKIQNFIFWLRDKCGMRFVKVTADQYQCLTGETLVNTGRGLLPIKHVKVGDVVSSKSGPNRVNGIHVYEDAPVVKITTNKGSVVCGTPNHRIEAYPVYKRWMLRDKQAEWLRLQDLSVGDVLSMVRKPVSVNSQNAQLIPPPSASGHSTVSLLQNWNYPTHITPQLAEWMGLVWGDGCISIASGVKLSVHELDRDCAEKVYKNLFGVVPKWNQSKKKKSGSLVFMESAFREWLEMNGFRKPGIKKKNGFAGDIGVPDSILASGQDVKAAFLRGLFSADGCVTGKEGYVSLSTKHWLTAHQVSIILRTEFGIHATVVKTWRVGFGKRRLQHIVRILGSREEFRRNIGFCYRTKQAKLNQFKDVPGRDLNERVAKIEISRDTVYDISVENDPSYTANGFISHNSAMPLQMLESRGIPSENLSVDKDNKVYTAFRQASEELRLRMYRQDMLMHEAENLVYIDGNKKVDHPKDGSKDTSDSAAGAYFNAITSEEKLMVAADNNPGIVGNQSLTDKTFERPPIEINLPLGYTKIKSFS